jgi:hypothetical protein
MSKAMSKRVETDLEQTDDLGALTTIDSGLASPGQMSLAIALSRAEVDQQVTTAHAYPRKHKQVIDGILNLASLDDETAEECVYALTRGKKAIRGPSIRFAEIVASSWGNCRDASRIIHIDRIEKYVEAEGVFHDLETGRVTTSRVRRRIFDTHGRIFNDDMILVTGAAASSIALRNAIMRGVPKAIWRPAYQAVERVIAGDIKTLSERRDMAVKSFAAWGISPERVFAALDVPGIEDVGVDDLVTLTAFRSAIKSGEATVEALFPEPKPERGAAPRGLASKLEALAGNAPPPDALDQFANADSGAPASAAEGSPPSSTAEARQAAPDEAADGGEPTRPSPAAKSGEGWGGEIKDGLRPK